MRQTLPAIAAALLAAATLTGAPEAAAGPPHCPPGHAKKGWCTPGGGGGSAARAYEEGYRDGRIDERRAWRRGDRLPRERYDIVRDYDRYGLRRPGDGRAWVRVDGDLFLIAAGTGLILEALAN